MSGPSAPPSRARVVVLTNGNYFANLVLTPLLACRDLDVRVVVTTGLRRQGDNRAREVVRLLRTWGGRLAAYKVATYALPLLAQVVCHRPHFVASTCRRRGVPVMTARDVHEPLVLRELRGFAPHVLVSVSCPYRVRAELLELPSVGAVNVHSSLLPAYAGVGTYLHVLAAGEASTGVTVHEMVEQFDAGRIVEQEQVPIARGTSAFDLFSAQCTAAAPLLLRAVLTAAREGWLQGVPQDRARRSYHGEPTRALVRAARRHGHPLMGPGDVRRLLARGTAS